MCNGHEESSLTSSLFELQDRWLPKLALHIVAHRKCAMSLWLSMQFWDENPVWQRAQASVLSADLSCLGSPLGEHLRVDLVVGEKQGHKIRAAAESNAH